MKHAREKNIAYLFTRKLSEKCRGRVSRGCGKSKVRSPIKSLSPYQFCGCESLLFFPRLLVLSAALTMRASVPPCMNIYSNAFLTPLVGHPSPKRARGGILALTYCSPFFPNPPPPWGLRAPAKERRETRRGRRRVEDMRQSFPRKNRGCGRRFRETSKSLLTSPPPSLLPSRAFISTRKRQ